MAEKKNISVQNIEEIVINNNIPREIEDIIGANSFFITPTAAVIAAMMLPPTHQNITFEAFISLFASLSGTTTISPSGEIRYPKT